MQSMKIPPVNSPYQIHFGDAEMNSNPTSQVRDQADLDAITDLYTLGPAGTNCGMAAETWFRQRRLHGRVHLFATLEEAAEAIPRDPSAALMACIAYPALNSLMFSNLGRMRLADCLIIPTYEMVLASRSNVEPRSAATHPAPRGLLPSHLETILTSSNAQAAVDCRAGRADACITTRPAAQANELIVRESFGPIVMGFTVHVFDPKHLSHPA